MKRLKIECNTPCMRVMNGTAGNLAYLMKLEKLADRKKTK